MTTRRPGSILPGLNNAVFTIVNTAMWKELPFDEADRLVDLRLVDTRGFGQVSPPDYRDWRNAPRSFDGLAAHTGGTMNLSDDRRSAGRLRGGYVSSNMFRLLRVSPIAGREFVAEDDCSGTGSVAMLSYEIWQSRYGGEPVIGRAVRVNGAPSTIIGIMPPGFAFPFMTQLWQPVSVAPGIETAGRDRRMLGLVAQSCRTGWTCRSTAWRGCFWVAWRCSPALRPACYRPGTCHEPASTTR